MTDYLIFTLTAMLGAMGELAGHERRPTLGWPGRSAILGLVAAAHGIRRDDTDSLAELDALRMAVAIFDAGTPLRDYHTVQTVPSAAVKRPDSRPSALRAAGRKANTTISLRDYRQSPLFGVALWGLPLAPIEAALQSPVFTLYLGRKACPLAAPLAPRIVQAEGPVTALNDLVLPPWRRGAVAKLLAADPEAGLTGRQEHRHDQPSDRRAWHFAARPVTLAPVEIAPKGAPS